MKLSIERATLLKAVAQAQSVVERRNTIPILANVLIEAEGESVQFRATDLDIEVVDRATAQVTRAGATTVSAVTLNEIVRNICMSLIAMVARCCAVWQPTGIVWRALTPICRKALAIWLV